MKKIFFCFLLGFFGLQSFAQNLPTLYPAYWWTGMKWNKLQVMVHGDKVAEKIPMIKMGANGITLAKGVSLVKINRVENSNYVFLDLVIAPNAAPGKFDFPFGNKVKLSYELKARRQGNGKAYAVGVNSADLIYLIMPDRFSNGDPSNDKFPGMMDTVADRSQLMLRHGGDLQGITNHLDYIKDLGVTTLWLTPVVKNDMPTEKEPPGDVSGYHGYWITDHYEIDQRYGGSKAYQEMIDAAHRKGLKVIQDAVYNHVGMQHWFVKDMPTKDWINQWPSYQGTNHREEVFTDPHVAAIDKDIMIKGWFVPHLPDLNLGNPFVANYMIQNTIWETENFGIDGWRVDTYKYNDEQFLVRINDALAKDFPKLTGFGEVVSNTVPPSAYFAKNTMTLPIKQNILGITDYPLCSAMLAGIYEDYGWTNGVTKIYMTLAQDNLYADPNYNCIFLDNHDMDRFVSVANEDINKYKMGINWLLTLRGIPQLYYGTEIFMKNRKNPTDALVRMDFPGGWAGDKEDKFTRAGRNDRENEAYDFVKKLAVFRASSPAIKSGKLMQYIPENGVYTYFRYGKDQTVMVISNCGNADFKVKADRFKERTSGFSKMKNVQTGAITPVADFTIAPKQSDVYELIK